MKRNAFTLAEVLITLVVIGIIAAMTIPILVNSYQERVNISSLKKQYSLFSNAFALAKKFDNNDPADWVHIDGNNNAMYENYKSLKKYFNVLRECPDKTGCWSKELTKAPTGKPALYANEKGIGVNIMTFTLSDGTNVCFDYFDTKDTINYFGVNKNLQTYPLAIWVDVNGDKKPNTMGRDVFAFIYTNNGVIPAGANNKSANCNTMGYDCSAKYIYKY